MAEKESKQVNLFGDDEGLEKGKNFGKEKAPKIDAKYISFNTLGETIQGVVVSIIENMPFTSKKGETGEGTIVIMDDIEQGRVLFWLSTVLKSWFAGNKIAIGDYIGIRYVGYRDTKYKNFLCKKG
jgi:ssDNA-binding replication factor A large subunit